jgi:hypothetical protein
MPLSYIESLFFFQKYSLLLSAASSSRTWAVERMGNFIHK